VTKIVYPLAQVLEVKRKRVKDAEKVVKQRQEELEKQQKKLQELEEKRDEVGQHKADKLAQLRQVLDTGTTSPEVRQMKTYLEVVEEKLLAAQAKVDEQVPQVQQAEKNLEEAKKILLEKRKEVQKLEEHEKEWMKQARKEEAIEEGRKLDDIGTTMYISRKKRDEN
jgi:flagellar export protein FliJ